MLNDREIRMLKNGIVEFGEHLKEECPDFPYKTKLHLLLNHVIPFVEEHRTWGLVNEQGIEATHTRTGKDMDKTVGSEEKKVQFALKANRRRFYVHDTEMD